MVVVPRVETGLAQSCLRPRRRGQPRLYGKVNAPSEARHCHNLAVPKRRFSRAGPQNQQIALR